MIIPVKHQTIKAIRNQNGFTLVELLCALAVGLLASSLIALAISMAIKSYRTEASTSDALTLCDTLSISVQDELLYADDIQGNGTSFDFISGGRACGQRCTIAFDDSGIPGLLSLQDKEFYPFVSSASVSLNLSANLMISWDPDDAVFEVFLNVRSDEGETMASSNFTVEPFNIN